jgi:hypothetical protein
MEIVSLTNVREISEIIMRKDEKRRTFGKP